MVTLLGKVQAATSGIVVTSNWNEADAITLSSESTLFLLRCHATRVNRQSAEISAASQHRRCVVSCPAQSAGQRETGPRFVSPRDGRAGLGVQKVER